MSHNTTKKRKDAKGERGGRGGRGGGRGRARGANRSFNYEKGRYPKSNERLMNARKFILKWHSADFDQLSSQWHSAWVVASSLPFEDLYLLSGMLAKLKSSSKICAPPLQDCCLGLKHLLSLTLPPLTTGHSLLEISRIVILCIKRLLVFIWNENSGEVKGQLLEVHCSVIQVIGRELGIPEVMKFFQEEIMPLPPLIEQRVRTSDVSEDVDESREEFGEWKKATIQWLMNPKYFNPQLLPKCKTPNGEGKGVYDSAEEYFETWLKLWIGIIWNGGYSSISPSCPEKGSTGSQSCGNALVQRNGVYGECSSRKCTQNANYGCSRGGHKYKLCQTCFKRMQKILLGPISERGSTNVYNGIITKTDWTGVINIEDVECRRPPQQKVNWNTTSRLSAPNLVGIVKLSSPNADLRPSDKIIWASVTLAYDKKKHGYAKRIADLLTVTLLPNTLVELEEHDPVAIIDCKTFVPEFLPVLTALLSIQREGLPLRNGALLNIGPQPLHREMLCYPDVLTDAISLMIQKSEVKPIQIIRDHPAATKALVGSLVRLTRKATLDGGQLKSFLEALTYPVHCTQGPPGTGKSYLGVVLTKALLLIRQLWIKLCPTEGEPPILVLSYKNHAIDEFLVDMLQYTKSFIRMGKPTNTRLDPFSEQARRRENRPVRDQRKVVASIISDFNTLNHYYRDLSQVLLSEGDTMDQHNESKLKIAKTFATGLIFTTMLFQHVSRHANRGDTITITTVKETLKGLHKKPHKLDPITRVLLYAEYDHYNHMDIIEILYDGIKHYDSHFSMSEILARWMTGFIPIPVCSYLHCASISNDGRIFCGKHQCCGATMDGEMEVRCPEPIANENASVCSGHMCRSEDCSLIQIFDQLYCHKHVCLVCLVLEEVSKEAILPHPRNLCDGHQFSLCSALTNKGKPCNEMALKELNYCEFHCKSSCKGKTKKGKTCTRFVERSNPYCDVHKNQESSLPITGGKCQAKTKKKKPCKGKPVSAKHLYCNDHLHLQPKEFTTPRAPLEIQKVVKEELPLDVLPVEITDAPILEEEIELVWGEDEEQQRETDNVDEVEIYENAESESVRHLREVYQVEEEEEGEEVEEEEESIEIEENLEGDTPIDPCCANWCWETSQEQRWERIKAWVEIVTAMLASVIQHVKEKIATAKQLYKELDRRAHSEVFEGVPLIGGTIVGCISRLDALRTLNPFAVIVEEASEVLEPLLVATFTSSVCKVEMIGDHLQLKPSMSQQFEFERNNKMNVSLFERLISAPTTAVIPSSVLSVQRRMRPNICDFTRHFYDEITEIEDAPNCQTKVIPVAPNMPVEGDGREVPGVLPHIFFWSHEGNMGKSRVGVSKENATEANMVVHFVDYLSKCGIPLSSIAVLTPYKGQMKLLSKELEQKNLFSYNSKSFIHSPSCRVSTVDRFQGDESDIIIVSLVIDDKSSTPFVKLENRMVVLLSRARIGMYVIGNLKFFQNKPPPHWAQSIALFKSPGTDDSLPLEDTTVAPLIYTGPKLGSAIPICCPLHRESVKLVKEAKQLQVGFCEVVCKAPLSICSHPCNLTCHATIPNDHNTKCVVLVDSPCVSHPKQIPCHNMFSQSNRYVRKKFECSVKVEIELPCSHKITRTCYLASQFSVSSYLCKEKAISDFIYPACKHELTCLCHEKVLWQQHPTEAKPCKEKVNYHPPCRHEVELYCHNAQQYQSGRKIYTCTKRQVTRLPRCSHDKKLICSDALSLVSWKGERNKTPGMVHETSNYGPIDMRCKHKVQYIPSCGHPVEMDCNTAYDHAQYKTYTCRTLVSAINPNCGHPCQVSCSEVAELNGWKLNLEPNNQPQHTSIILPRSVTPCKKMIMFEQKCGHSVSMVCSVSQQKGGPLCKEMVSLTHPYCLHSLTLPCEHASRIDRWVPWVSASPSDHVATFLGTGVLSFATVGPPQPPKDLHIICRDMITFVRKCGHRVTLPCHQAFSQLQKPLPCGEKQSITLACGHTETLTCASVQDYVCKKKIDKPCYNFDVCGTLLSRVCSDNTLPECVTVVPWICKQGHSIDIQQCKKGIPIFCPHCCIEKANAYCSDTKDFIPQQTFPIDPSMYDTLETIASNDNFTNSKLELLRANAAWLEKTLDGNPWKVDDARYREVPCFFQITKKKKFDPKNLSNFAGNTSVGYGIQLKLLTTKNINGISHNGTSRFVFGYASIVRTLIHLDTKEKIKKVDKWATQQKTVGGYDSVLLSDSIVLYPPYCFCGHLVGSLSLDQRMKIAAALPEQIPPFSELLSTPLNGFTKNNMTSTIPTRKRRSGVKLPCLRGTFASGVNISDDWLVTTSLACNGYFTANQEKQLHTKLIKRNNKAPHAGLQYLQELESTDLSQEAKAEIILFQCIEHIRLQSMDEANETLQRYCAIITKQIFYGHPLLLPVFACLNPEKVTEYIQEFIRCTQITMEEIPSWIKILVEKCCGSLDKKLIVVPTLSVSLLDQWNELKHAEGFSSTAMEDLLEMVGLRKVKEKALTMFKSSVAFNKMTPKQQKNNQPTLNYAFLGNPGTGKTTVARLFAAILCDSGMRKTNNIKELTAQEAKDLGPKEFRKTLKETIGGVLFIDEAYELDPSSDKSGKSIVSELLTAAENHRTELSIILAGYQDDINSKLYSFNQGLKSRFEDVIFEDFDKNQLLTIWNKILVEREVSADASIGDVAVARLLLCSNKKGFGNAREVRSIIDKAVKASMLRGSTSLSITMADVIGERITENNPKIKEIKDELSTKEGWHSVKASFDQMIATVQTNYDREIQGLPTLPFQLNRLFLGNPGTGKTTCAKIYGRLLKNLNILSDGGVVDKKASDFIGQVIGSSQTKTNDILRLAEGKVLLIDEGL